MELRQAIISQYLAALEMLKQTILACPETLWVATDGRNNFSQIAYHALFFTHLYLQKSRQTFQPWSGHRDEYRFERDLPAAPGELVAKAVVLEYLGFCQHQVEEQVSTMELEAASGFDWLRFTKFELQLYSIRHIQQHVGELMERLGTDAKVEIDWVGTRRVDASGPSPNP